MIMVTRLDAPSPAAGALTGALARAGTRLMFGVPGGGPNLDVVGAATEAGLRFVLARGETAATIMAATSADLTGAPGAVVVTRGPGLASAVNGIAHAALDRLPVVIIADTVADAGRISHQRIDQATLGGSVARAAVTVSGPRTAAQAVGAALAAPPGPVVANMDDSAPDEDGPTRRVVPVNGAEAQTLRAAADLAARAGRGVLAEAMRAARRPVLLLGTGAIPHASGSPTSSTGSGSSTRAMSRPTPCATRRWTSGGCCSSSRW